MGATIELTADRLRSILSYDPDTGLFTWLAPRPRPTGAIAGARDAGGYTVIRIDGKLYRACRLAWLHVTGSWPVSQIDHINMSREDDRWENLRQATNSQNNMNRRARKDNASGFKGVFWIKRQSKWGARVTVDGRSHYLGSFESPSDAHLAYVGAALRYHQKFARVQ